MCAWVRRETRPATHERDRTAEERTARQRRINEAGDSITGTYQILRQRRPLLPPPHPPLPRLPTVTAHVQKHGDNTSLHKALHSCAVSTVPPVLLVTQSGRGDVTAAASAKAILRLKISLLGIPFKTVDNLATKMQRPLARPPFTILFTARSQCHQVTPSMTAHFQTAPFATSFSQSETSSYSPIFAEHPQ